MTDEPVSPTRGPWTVEEVLDVREFDAACTSVRLVHAGRNGDVAYAAHGPERDANARLIAAAPEMLAMLYRVLGSQWTGDDVRALIAKAEGRS